MKNENHYWKQIASKYGITSNGMKSVNYYLKKIYQSLGGTEIKNKPNQTYLKYIEEHIGSNGVTVDWEINGTNFAHLITSVTVPSGVESIGNYFFSNFINATEISIPSTVTSFGTATFPSSNTSKLEKVHLYYTENPPTYVQNKMKIPSTAKFIIPSATLDIYVNADYPQEQLEERE